MKFLKKLFKSKPKFKIGQKVKCIDDRYHPIVYGKEYIIINIMYLNCCNSWAYDVGLHCDENEHTLCCDKDIPGKGIRWAGEFRFAPIISDENSEEVSAEELIEAEKSIMRQTKKILERTLIYDN